MSSLAKHVIHQPKPYRYVLFIIIAIAISSTIQWYFYQQGNLAYQQQIVELHQSIQQLNIELKQNDQRNELLNKYNVQLDDYNGQLNNKIQTQHYELAIEQATVEHLQQQLDELQQQVITLSKDLLFYQTVTQGNGSSELQIRDLQLRPDKSHTNIIHYRLVITQGKKINKPISGEIILVFNALQDGETAQQTLGEHKLNLRHVQIVEGQLEIADNATAESIIITLKQGKKTLLRQTFDWQLTDNP